MSELIIENAVIERASISSGDRGFLDAWLTLDYGESGQGFGGFVLYVPKSWAHFTIESPAGHFIFRCMEIAGVTEWDQLVGKTIRVKKASKYGSILAIGHIVKNDWFSPEEDFKDLSDKTPKEAKEVVL